MLEDASEIVSDETWLTEFEDEDLKQAAFQLLDADDAELLRLLISELSITEIARITGIKRTTLEMRLKRIHEFLRKNLK